MTPIRSYIAERERNLAELNDAHRTAATALSTWLKGRLQRENAASVIVVCTGNSRRSVFGAVMGNLTATYYGVSGLHFYSGGTAPSAVNIRTVRALREIGVEIDDSGREAQRGELQTKNSIYSVRCGDREEIEFSKVYNDPHNPQSEFAALLVCTEADSACPSVAGADIRILCPFVDPKEADGTDDEAARYSEIRDQIADFMVEAIKSL